MKQEPKRLITKETAEQLEQETKKRVAKMQKEFSIPPKMKVFENTEKYSQLISQVGVPVTALCEHHEVSFTGDVSIGYIPGDVLIGLSKLARVSEYFLNPTVKTVQEKATQQISNYLEKTLKPKGLMVIVRARHNCVSYRGIKKPSVTITSSVTGLFKDDLGLRQEFLQIVHLNSEKI